MQIQHFLEQDQHKSLLRFVFVGSVDDGKSTLIGRLLHDTDGVYEDQLQAVKKASKQEVGEIDFSLFTDGLQAEREQGITIDVAYRYFATPRRKFIVADTPGHVQYTRNMVTGASTANVAVILIDARYGVLPQSKRHAYIASLLGIPHLAVAVNKMDLVDFREDVYQAIRKDFLSFTQKFRFEEVRFFPVSALEGDNVVEQSARTPWYEGDTFLSYLEEVPQRADQIFPHFRYPVQWVLRPNLNYRGFAGQVAAGRVRVADEVLVLPSGKKTRIKGIDLMNGSAVDPSATAPALSKRLADGESLPAAHTLSEARAPQSVALRLDDEIDISRGDMICSASHPPFVAREFAAHLVWLAETPLDTEKSYLLKHTTQMVRVQIESVDAVLDLETLEHRPAEAVRLNDIVKVQVATRRALYLDAYEQNRSTGAFVLIDSSDNATVGAGMVIDRRAGTQSLEEALGEIRAGSALEPKTQVSPRERTRRLGQQGCVIWLHGRPGSGRWSLAYALERKLFDEGHTCHVVDPRGLSLSELGVAARACARGGLVTVCAYPSYKKEDRAMLRTMFDGVPLVEVFVDTDAALCAERRPKEQPARFDAPRSAALKVDLSTMKMRDAVAEVSKLVETRGLFAAR